MNEERMMLWERPADIDLGSGHLLWWIAWAPDRALNPHYADLPDDPRHAAHWRHPAAHDATCEGHGAIQFDGPLNRLDTRARWTVHTWDPLTITPSVLCRACGTHGFITGGRWVSA